MMSSATRSILFLLIFAIVAFPVGAVVITETSDTYVDSASPNSNFVESPAIKITQNAFGLIRFGLTALPSDATTSQVVKATLQLWQMPDSLNVVGSISIYEITSDFAMRTVTYNTRPSLASSPVATVVLPGNSRYVEVDVTPLVKKWMTTPASNYGIAVLPAPQSTALDLNLGTKWNLAASQPPILDITLQSGRTVAVCLNADFGRVCTCTGRLVSRVAGGSCSATSDTGSCYEMAAGMAANNPVASCCVCAV